MKKAIRFIVFITLYFLVSPFSLSAQNVGINTTTPHNSAALDITSTSKGVLVPRMTTTQRTAIASPATGLLVFDTDLKQFYFYNGSAWTGIPLSNLAKIQDADGNTKIEVEKTANDNLIRFSADGTEYFKMNKGTLEVTNTGGSVFIGQQAGLNESYGASNRNVGVGYKAMQYASGSYDNVAVGAQSLFTNSDGNYNVAIGTEVLRSNNGQNNVGIGTFAGVNNATGNGNVFLGYESGKDELGSNKLYIANSGTTTPLIYGDFNTNQLKINGSLNINNAYILPSVVGTTGQYLQTNGSGTASWATLPAYLTTETDPKIGSLTTNYLSKWNGATLANTQVFDNGTNVGIGTTTPSVKLDVAGEIKATTLTAKGGLVVDSDNLNNSDGVNILRFGSATSGEGIGSSRQITNNNKGLDFYTDNLTRLSIAKWGGVGIGTIFPANALDINGGVAIGASYVENNQAPLNGAIIEGNVGIGKLNPTTKLDVNGTTKTTNFQMTTGATLNYILKSDANGNASWVHPNSVYLGTWLPSGANQYSTMVGNVGIGTTTPSTKLEVSGTTKTTNLQMTTGATDGYLLKSDANGNAAWVNPNTLTLTTETDPKIGSLTTNYLAKWNGATLANTQVFDNGTNVGIGTTTPSVKLEISGTTKTTNWQMTNGATNGYVLKSDASGNATWVNPTSLTTATQKVLQDADGNTNIEVEKIANEDKIRFMLGGTERFVMAGSRIDVSNTGGSTFFGANAGANDDLTNNQNTFIGYYVGKQTTTGADNVGMGRSALELNTTGGRNTALGYVTLSNLTTGTGNTAVGSFAGQNATGSDNVFLGYGAGANETGNSKLYIHNTGTSTPLIYGDFAANILTVNGKMGIGTTTPTQAKLVVNGSASNTLTYGYFNSSGASGTFSNGTNNYSIYASDRIAATEFNAYSDRRIKKILRGSNSEEDLATLMKLKITDYQLIDSISKGNTVYKKVIAQEVAEVYPNAVTKMTDFIPNIYQLASIKNGFVALTNPKLVVGDKVKLIFDDRQDVVKVLKINENGFYTEGVTDGAVFVFGKEVNDFHTVDYEALSTLNISVTQALVKQINDLKADNAAMKSDIEQIKAAIAKKGL